VLAEVQSGEVLDLVERRSQATPDRTVLARLDEPSLLEHHPGVELLGVPVVGGPEQGAELTATLLEVPANVRGGGQGVPAAGVQATDELGRGGLTQDVVDPIEREVQCQLPVDLGAAGLCVGDLQDALGGVFRGRAGGRVRRSQAGDEFDVAEFATGEVVDCRTSPFGVTQLPVGVETGERGLDGIQLGAVRVDGDQDVGRPPRRAECRDEQLGRHRGFLVRRREDAERCCRVAARQQPLRQETLSGVRGFPDGVARQCGRYPRLVEVAHREMRPEREFAEFVRSRPQLREQPGQERSAAARHRELCETLGRVHPVSARGQREDEQSTRPGTGQAARSGDVAFESFGECASGESRVSCHQGDHAPRSGSTRRRRPRRRRVLPGRARGSGCTSGGSR
jgi:hypothetical protein